ncbi:fimbrial protein [Enterobacter sp. ENT03]|uniref:fimbrial protein n=1 Tax=Enterobacter sp. ENT03 TaxID=2854780 RepID=UPI001C472707|nr:fimbrial protein [Enterobacter sp. ENT03]MBV7403497.1 fimbrial protein [Enterobacter sp. ENT03]
MRSHIYGWIFGLMFIPYSHAETLSGSIGVRFFGTILAQSCDVKESDREQTISLGDHDRKLFTHAGAVSPAQSLNITLINCQAERSTDTINLSFTGNADPDDSQLLKLTGNDDQGNPLSGIASGIAVELLDEHDNRIALNSDIHVPMQTGDTPLPTVKLRYRATRVPVTPGEANAILWVRLRYEE